MTKPVDVSDQDFTEKVIEADKPVLVDFWAEWCGPCRMVAPIVEELASEYEGKVDFTKLNVDFNPTVATTFGIRSIPTLLVFKGGKPVDQVIGAVPKAEIKKRLEAALAN